MSLTLHASHTACLSHSHVALQIGESKSAPSDEALALELPPLQQEVAALRERAAAAAAGAAGAGGGKGKGKPQVVAAHHECPRVSRHESLVFRHA